MTTEKLPLPMNHDFRFVGQGWDDVEGRSYAAFTDKGRPIRVWVPAIGNDLNDRYFCHGLTLGTWERYGYSVCSAEDVEKVLIDEFTCRGPNLADAQQGDIVSFQNPHGIGVVHTCRVVNCATVPKTAANITVWTKNGRAPEAVLTLANVMGIYAGTHILFWH